MPSKNDSWGIEIGANALKAVHLVKHGSRAELEDYGIIPFKTILSTPDLNVDEMIQVNLDAFMTKHDVSKSNVVVSVPGHMAFARFAKMPPVEPRKIPEIVRYEAIQQIPFPIQQVEWDYQVFQQADSPDVEVGIFAITKDRVMAFLNNYRKVGLRIDALTLSPIAVYNAFSYDNVESPEADGTIYMDIGTQSTDVIIVEGGGIWLRTLPIGGNNFTEALVRAFKLSFPKAEKLKREAGTSKYARQIFQAMRPVFADLVQELQRSLGYYQSLNRDAQLTRVVGVGSTFRLPGLKKFLKQQLQMEVDRVDTFKRIHADAKREAEFADSALNMATAYGLALQGLGLESVSANILPSHILKARMWKAKQPWIAASAASVLVASGLAFGAYMQASAAEQASRAENTPKIQRVLDRGNRFVSEYNNIQKEETRGKIENLRRLLDYQDLWPKITEDINSAMLALDPQPDLFSADEEAIKK
ncbi:MAG: type IV pilus assembly protein PilM, partial [Rhodospirillales bacterium]|nr:type IV pilus assembly protein PilM [Rhodospirillales bacterium]